SPIRMKGYPMTVIYLPFDLDWKLHRPGDTSGAECLKKSSLESKVKSSGMFIDGEWVHSKTGEKIDVVNPATERVIGRVPRANREEVKEALEVARDAQPKWEDTPPIKRAA